MSSSTVSPGFGRASAPGRLISSKRGTLFVANLGSAVEALWVNRLRSSLTMLGIIIGVAAVITVVTLLQGITAQFNANLAGLQADVLNVFPGTGRVGASKFAGGNVSLTPGDAQAMLSLPHVVNVSPELYAGSQVPMIYSNRNWTGVLRGVSYTYRDIMRWPTSEGAWWSGGTEAQALPVVVIGQTIVNNIYAPLGLDPIGQPLRIGAQLYRVVGVLSIKGSAAAGSGRDQDNIAFASYTSMLRSTGHNANAVNGGIDVQVDSIDTMTQVRQEVEALLRQRHRLATDTPDDFNLTTPIQSIQTQQHANDTFTNLLLGLAAVSLVGGGIGIMNILLASVTERTREIGLRAAMGAQPSDIRNQFLIEALMLCTLGGGLGLLIGLLAGGPVTQVFQLPYILSPLSFVVAFGVSTAVGIVFGLYPALRASYLDPVVALRSE